jgi:hypothetical protein
MGIPMISYEETNLENIKNLKENYLQKLTERWNMVLNNFQMISKLNSNNFYSVTSMVKIFDDGFPLIRQEVQNFIIGEELQLLQFLEYIKTNFILHYTIISIRSINNEVVNSTTIGEPIVNFDTAYL